MASTTLTTESVAPMRQRQSLEFPYKHSTGETIGRFLAGLKEQKRIWGQRVSGQGVVVPPLGYSEVDGSDGGEWVEVKDTGVITAAARVDKPIERLHLSTSPFAFVLVKLDGADTALAHIVKSDLDRVAVGARVQVVWAADDARVGSIRDIDSFEVIADAPAPKTKAEAKSVPTKVAKAAPPVKKAVTTKSTKATKKPSAKKAVVAKGAKTKVTPKTKATKTKAKVVKPTKKKVAAKKPAAKKAAAKKVTKPSRAKSAKPAKAKARKPTPKKKPAAKKPAAKKPARGKTKSRRR